MNVPVCDAPLTYTGRIVLFLPGFETGFQWPLKLKIRFSQTFALVKHNVR